MLLSSVAYNLSNNAHTMLRSITNDPEAMDIFLALTVSWSHEDSELSQTSEGVS